MKKNIDTTLFSAGVVLFLLLTVLNNPFTYYVLKMPLIIIQTLQTCIFIIMMYFFIIFLKKYTLYIYSGNSRFFVFTTGIIFQVINILTDDDIIILKGCGYFLKNKIFIFKLSTVCIDYGVQEYEYLSLRFIKRKPHLVPIDALPYSISTKNLSQKKVVYFYIKTEQARIPYTRTSV